MDADKRHLPCVGRELTRLLEVDVAHRVGVVLSSVERGLGEVVVDVRGNHPNVPASIAGCERQIGHAPRDEPSSHTLTDASEEIDGQASLPGLAVGLSLARV